MSEIKKIMIVPNSSKDNNFEYLREVIDIIDGRAEIYISDVFLPYGIENVIFAEKKIIYSKVDLILVLGGDGTLLSAANDAAFYEIPVLGVNLGRLGFLAEVERCDVNNCLNKLFAGDFIIEDRMMLSACVLRGNEKMVEFNALNDIVVTKGVNATLMDFNINICGEFVDDYKSDGVILSTPTGSTAYSLSAGGPLVSPDLEVILLTPICPHKLYSRALVVSADDTIEIKTTADEIFSAAIMADGQKKSDIKEGDILVVKRSERVTKLVRLTEKGFYGKLRQKLMGKELEN
ncbi:MAG: NAD(+)/NADH kinase [Ruminococcaceae bacterium]|nr:NAD(+)/NADH kinase [Oscillospiraceae bacterium]